MLHWRWPWAILIAVAACALIGLVVRALDAHRHGALPQATVFDIDDDLRTDEGTRMLRLWRRWNRAAAVLAVLALITMAALVGRPARVAAEDEHSANRDIVLCLDVSGSTLPYDQQVIATYRTLISHFKGERIGLSIFNSTSRTVFPLTDDYAMAARQLEHADDLLRGVETQDDIDKMSAQQYQQVSDWLAGTQSRKNATSLIGDGLVSCAAMLPGFTYGGTQADQSRDASIVLATDNVVSGTQTYTLAQALDLTSKAGITVDGLFSGPSQSDHDEATEQMRTLIEQHHGTFLLQSDGDSVADLVRAIDRRQISAVDEASQADWTDAPGWWTLAIAVLLAGWLIVAWRLKR